MKAKKSRGKRATKHTTKDLSARVASAVKGGASSGTAVPGWDLKKNKNA